MCMMFNTATLFNILIPDNFLLLFMLAANIREKEGLIEARWEFSKAEHHDDLGFHHPNAQPVRTTRIHTNALFPHVQSNAKPVFIYFYCLPLPTSTIMPTRSVFCFNPVYHQKLQNMHSSCRESNTVALPILFALPQHCVHNLWYRTRRR
jgi:hypothetical protein